MQYMGMHIIILQSIYIRTYVRMYVTELWKTDQIVLREFLC